MSRWSAIATSGALHLIRARAAPKPSERADAARLAQASLENALKANHFLKREYEPLLAEAQAISGAALASASATAPAPEPR